MAEKKEMVLDVRGDCKEDLGLGAKLYRLQRLAGEFMVIE